MKKSVAIILFAFASLFSYADKPKILVAFYSQNGATKQAAQRIADATGGELFEIVPKTPYPASHDPCLKKQMSDIKNGARPELKDAPPDISKFDKIFIGYPIWYYQAPLLINTFLEAQNFSGKTVIPFCTSGAFPIDKSIEELKPLAKNALWKKGLRVSGNKSELENWLKEIEK